MNHSSNTTTELHHRPIGLISLVCLIVANMIGAGVYTTSGFAVAALGRPLDVLLVWGIGGAIAIAGAICYGGLARQLVQSGGEYLFLAHGVHPLAGFMAGWISLLAGFTGAIAYAAVTFTNYVALQERTPSTNSWIASVLILACTLIHFFRTESGAKTQNVMVFIKLLAVLVFVAWAVAVSDPQKLLVRTDSASNVAGAGVWATQLMWISFSFAGFNAAIYVAGETKNGERTVRQSMLWSTIGVTLLYFALNYVFLATAPLPEIVGAPDIAAVSARYVGGAKMNIAIRAIIALSLATSVSAMIQAGPRVYAKMAHDGVFPKLLANSHRVPRAAMLLQAGLALVLVWFVQLKEILDYTSFLLSVSSAATVGCLLLPRFRGQPRERPVPFWPWLPICFSTVTLGIAVISCHWQLTKPQADRGIWLGLVVFAAGAVIYFASRLRSPGR
ncbi:MAG: amino acid permease [Pirellulaceae bacterium]